MALTVDSTKTWSADDNMDSTFHFFDLPRELRNSIFEEILHEPFEVTQSSRAKLHVRAAGFPSERLQRVSKQFRHEILEKAAGRCCIELRDHERYTFGGFEVQSSLRSNILHAEIHLELFGNILYTIRRNQDNVIAPLAEFCNLQYADIKLYLNYLPRTSRCKRTLPREQSHIIDSIPVTSESTSIEVYEYVQQGTKFAFDAEKRLVMKFDPAAREIKILQQERAQILLIEALHTVGWNKRMYNQEDSGTFCTLIRRGDSRVKEGSVFNICGSAIYLSVPTKVKHRREIP